MVALGIPLIEVIKMTTVNPAKILKLDDQIGYLKKGYKADIAVFQLEEGQFQWQDTAGNSLSSNLKLINKVTFKNGQLLQIPEEPKPCNWALRDIELVSGLKC
ncbi:hypothetical protein K502DRAFT_184837 [Neoconidiobolus thromboides FSU 785]|nr:hypothetical protein K502DRAFT_184837 [Neoconidiobolus thromboides FSU 785]